MFPHEKSKSPTQIGHLSLLRQVPLGRPRVARNCETERSHIILNHSNKTQVFPRKDGRSTRRTPKSEGSFAVSTVKKPYSLKLTLRKNGQVAAMTTRTTRISSFVLKWRGSLQDVQSWSLPLLSTFFFNDNNDNLSLVKEPPEM